MRHLVVCEHEQIQRSKLGSRLLRRLKRFDSACARTSGQTVFDWSNIDSICAQNYVGIIQVPGLMIEILPKLTRNPSNPALAAEKLTRQLAQKNLLYMLSLAGQIPFEERQLADQRIERLPLVEVLVGVFARTLLAELGRGVPRDYVTREENVLFLKGKLLHGLNASLNAAHRERLFVRYEEFLADTPLNRILKATCEQLRRVSLPWRTRSVLSEASSVLGEVEDIKVTPDLFEQIHFNRNTERFSPILAFCRIVLLGQMPTPELGRSRTFSLLFPMEQVFEGFVGGLLRRYPGSLGVSSSRVRLQSEGRKRWLARTPEGRRMFRLRPDVLIEDASRKARCVLDTKWKRPKANAEDAKNGVRAGDMYQLYAYARRFDSPDNVLLYPAVAGATAKAYHLQDADRRRQIRVEFIDLARDLYAERTTVLLDLRGILGRTASSDETG